MFPVYFFQFLIKIVLCYYENDSYYVDITKPIGYNPNAPKRYNYTVYLYNLKLVEVIEPEEKVSVVMEIGEFWFDPRLAWNPSLYGDIEMLHMRQDKVWSPTINMFRINDIADFRDNDFRMVAVENTGRVYDSISLRVSLNCPLDVRKFPFDSQSCTIQFSMPLFFIQYVEMISNVYIGIMNKTLWEKMGNSEWEFRNLSHRVEVLQYLDGYADMQLATFEIKIQRNPLYYIYMIVFPSFIINALSIVGVFMKDTDKMSKVRMPEWSKFLDQQEKLVSDLFEKYDSSISPVYSKIDITKPIGYNPIAPKRYNYTVFMYNIKLVEVLEPEEKVSVVMEMAEHWYDPRLAWNPSLYDDIEMLHMRQEKVWSPTINMFRINDVADFRDQDFRMVSLDNTGHIYSSLSLRVSVNCPLDVRKFPFDSQTCTIQFSMPLFFIQYVEMFSQIYDGILNKTVWKRMGNSEWDLVNLTNRVEILSYNDGIGDMQLATFEVKIQRNPMYYIYMIVFPSFVINALSIVGVFMKKTDKMSKLNVGLTNIMTMTFILGVMADKIPRTGSIPLLGIYIIINLFIMIVAVGITVLMGSIRKCAIPRLRMKKTKMRQGIERILGDPMETICMIVLGTINAVNFLVVIVFWIRDS
ncbi:hypothetical protein B9Z55_006072 [Caenorhabditis nigoni]|uniref:Neurotransmitter-gated ion-channel ligand-binding domain-containing protein n=1 Tax=Caenorhabditis nigoni TaxID=1611254 RepID=A0A2G5V3I4_9PELO|nr:hypothetical protein B9Z55_006072 [Caenorhabditis nigoni]